jgi:hypothetical protein
MIDSDWLVLREMRPAIEKFAAKVAHTDQIAIDLGCGSQPYRPIFDSHGSIYRGADMGAADIVIEESGRVATDDAIGTYRTGAFAALFPNRLEISMRWRST